MEQLLGKVNSFSNIDVAVIVLSKLLSSQS